VIAVALLLAVQAKPPSEPARAILDRWRESIELDLAHEVAAEAPALVEGSGRLAHDGEAIALAARAFAAAAQRERAQKLLDAARPDPATSAFVELARARLAVDADELEKARAILLAPGGGAVRHESIPECWLLAGRALYRAGDPAGAAPRLERFLALAPLDAEAPSAWHMLAQAAIARGAPSEAAALREKALASAAWQDFYRARRLQVRESPDAPLPRVGIAELLLAAGAHERARDAALAVVARWPECCRGREALGRAWRGLGKLAEARAELERAVACDPGSLRGNLELARVLLAAGENAAAEARYARYRELGGREGLSER
jgi:tetratricopeptide (TPR) repeat protein